MEMYPSFAKKEGNTRRSVDIHVSMTENDGTSRFFVLLDSEKYGKNSAIKDLTDVEILKNGSILFRRIRIGWLKGQHVYRSKRRDRTM